jgi:hypothetical protein
MHVSRCRRAAQVPVAEAQPRLSPAETTLRLLGDGASWLERRLLSNVTYYTDYAITHTDEAYMQSNHDMRPEQRDNYFVSNYDSDPGKIEMSFNLTTYQPHLAASGVDVYQTYYLDKQVKHLWTDACVDKSKILTQRWMRQFAHTWQHFAFFVPW